MKAISIKQPWAKAIAQGYKKIEVRTWTTAFRGDLLICASARPDTFLKTFPTIVHPTRGIWCEDMEEGPESEGEGFYHFGKAIAVAELFDIEKMTSAHEIDALCEPFPGAFAWKLRNIRMIKPFPVSGKLRLFDIDHKIELL